MENEREIPTAAEFEAAGLYDPNDPKAARKLELLELLASNGATVDEMVELAELGEDAVPLAATNPWPGQPRLTAAEVAERTGMTRDEIVEVWRAGGFVDPGERRIFVESDVASFEFFQAGMAFVGREHALQFSRILGASMARVADAAVSLFVVDIGRVAYAQDPVGLDLARTNLTIASMVPAFEHSMSSLLRHHMESGRRSPDRLRSAHENYETDRLAVGFIDLVDSTVMTRELEPSELGVALSAFESVVSDRVTARGGRLVKLIGDEAMFVCPSPIEACTIALESVDEFRSHEVLPMVRVGLAYGDVVLRDGDFFGPVVNLAARLVKAAEPSGAVIEAGLIEELSEGERNALPLGDPFEHVPKGFDQPVRCVSLAR